MPISRDVLDQLRYLLRPLATRVANTVARGVVRLVNDSRKLQLVQLEVLEVLDGDPETVDGAEHFQPYGFFSVPLAGAEAIVVFPNGDRGHPLVTVVSDRRHRATGGQPGEAGLRTDEGDEIRLGRSHVITVTTSTLKLGSSSAAGDVVVQSALTGEQGYMAALDSAIATLGANPAAAALTALKTALQALNASQGWKAGTSKVKAE